MALTETAPGQQEERKDGRVIAIAGPVVDVEFQHDVVAGGGRYAHGLRQAALSRRSSLAGYHRQEQQRGRNQSHGWSMLRQDTY